MASKKLINKYITERTNGNSPISAVYKDYMTNRIKYNYNKRKNWPSTKAAVRRTKGY